MRAPHCWTVRRSPDGTWQPDWAETEPDPVPVPTIAWLTWHIGWWWSTATAHARGAEPRSRTEITWPGGTLAELTDDDLNTTAPFPVPNDPTYTISDMVAWANA